VLLDRVVVQSFTVHPASRDLPNQLIDANLKFRLTTTAGPHDLGVTFIKNTASLLETGRQPYESHFNMHRSPRLNPAIYQVSITGPFEDKGAGETPSRQRIFVTKPASPQAEDASARQILAALMRRAYRRPVTDADVDRVMPFYREARRD